MKSLEECAWGMAREKVAWENVYGVERYWEGKNSCTERGSWRREKYMRGGGDFQSLSLVTPLDNRCCCCSENSTLFPTCQSGMTQPL